MPIPTVWIVTRRPKKAFVGVAGGLKGAEDLAEADARYAAGTGDIPVDSLTVWSEHGEAPAAGKKFTRASVHVASTATPTWTVTYDCVVHTIYQRPTPKTTTRRSVPARGVSRTDVAAEVERRTDAALLQPI